MTTSTLRYTTITRVPNPAAAILRAIADAADRAACRESATAYADRVLDTLRSEGATRVGFKVCHDSGWKQREVHSIDDAACRDLIIRTAHMDAEVWGLNDDGDFSHSIF